MDNIINSNEPNANMVNPSVTQAQMNLQPNTSIINTPPTQAQTNLQSNENSVIIEPQGNAGAVPEAGTEDAAGYQSIIEQQQQQIDALIARNESLTAQFSRLIANGAQLGEPATAAQQLMQQQMQQQQNSPYEDVPSLADIGKSLVNKKE